MGRSGAEFDRNFAERGEIGAAVAAYWHGEKVVDLWGGRRTPTRDEPWNEDTMVVVNSTTKGLAAMTVAVANSRGWIDYDARVVEYWPEFAQNGKGAITVRQLLSHEAGLSGSTSHCDSMPFAISTGYRPCSRSRSRPGNRERAWLPRDDDPAHRALGRFFAEEIAKPLQIEFYIGLPPEIPDTRCSGSRSSSTSPMMTPAGPRI